MSMNDLMKSKNKIRNINKSDSNRSKSRKKQSFDDRYKRVTTYLEHDLTNMIEELIYQGVIHKKTEFFNTAIKEYIKNHYE